MVTVLSGRGRERTYSGIPSHTGRPRHWRPDLGGGWTGRGVGFGDESQSKRSLAPSRHGVNVPNFSRSAWSDVPATPLPAYQGRPVLYFHGPAVLCSSMSGSRKTTVLIGSFLEKQTGKVRRNRKVPVCVPSKSQPHTLLQQFSSRRPLFICPTDQPTEVSVNAEGGAPLQHWQDWERKRAGTRSGVIWTIQPFTGKQSCTVGPPPEARLRNA